MKSRIPALRTLPGPGRLVCLLAAFCLVAVAEVHAADNEAGMIITLTPGAFVERNGAKILLEVKAPLHPGDTLITDATGRVRVWLNDDSTVSLGPDTLFTLEDYAAEGSNPRFLSRLGGGLMRILTGKIVEANPDGFSVTTPEATVGIRGTILSVRSRDGTSTVFVENTMRRVFVNGADVPGNHKAVVSRGGQPGISPIQPQDRRELARDLAFRGGAGSAAAALEPGASVAASAGENLEMPRAPAGLEETALAALPLNDMTTLAILPTTAYVNGSLTPGGTGAIFMGGTPADFSGSFSFEVDLAGGAISNGRMSGSSALFAVGNGILYDLHSGTGTMSNGNFTVNGFQGIMEYPLGSSYAAPAGSHMAGSGNVDAVGGAVSGNYFIDGAGVTGWTPDEGTFSGTRTK
jgi:hypothetical protein